MIGFITFYRNGFRTLGRGLRPVRRWTRRHPRWSKVLIVVLIDAVIVLIGNTYAYAAGADGPLAPFLPGGSIHDSSGIPLSHYTKLPLDRGDLFHPDKVFLSYFVDPIWTGHLGFVAWMLWFLEWLLSFEWVGFIATPIQGFANTIEAFLSRIHWIPIALSISGLVAGIAIFTGKVVRGGMEMLISAIVAVLAIGVLSNPVASLTAVGGALDTAKGYGSEIAAAVVADRNSAPLPSDDVLSEAVTTQLADIFVRVPAQTITFGHVLSGDCATRFDEAMKSSAPVISNDNTVRDQVSACDATAKAYVENPNFGEVVTAGIVATGGLGLFALAIALALFFIVTVVFFLIAALKTMWNVYLAILPVSRYGLWRSLGDTFMGLVSIVLMTVLMAAYLKFLVAILNATSSLGIVAQMGFVNLMIIVLIIVLWRVRQAAKRAGRTMAEQLARLGMGAGGPNAQEKAMALMSMSAIASTVRSFVPARRSPAPQITDNRSINFVGIPTGGGAEEPVDLGTLHAQRAPKAPPAPVSGGSALPTRRALPAPQRAAQGVQKAARVAQTAQSVARVAKAAPGGVGAVAGAAAVEVGGAALRRKPKALGAGSTPAPEAPQRPVGPRRIVVGADGVGHIERQAPRPTSTPAIPQPPRALPPSPRSSQMRELLAGAKGD